jgi:hypothetical protein
MARPCLLYENSFLFDYLHIYFQAILGHSWAGRLIFGDLAPISLRTYQNNPALAHHAPTKSETSVVSSSPPKQTCPSTGAQEFLCDGRSIGTQRSQWGAKVSLSSPSLALSLRLCHTSPSRIMTMWLCVCWLMLFHALCFLIEIHFVQQRLIVRWISS